MSDKYLESAFKNLVKRLGVDRSSSLVKEVECLKSSETWQSEALEDFKERAKTLELQFLDLKDGVGNLMRDVNDRGWRLNVVCDISLNQNLWYVPYRVDKLPDPEVNMFVILTPNTTDDSKRLDLVKPMSAADRKL